MHIKNRYTYFVFLHLYENTNYSALLHQVWLILIHQSNDPRRKKWCVSWKRELRFVSNGPAAMLNAEMHFDCTP